MNEQGIDDRTRLLGISERARCREDEVFEDEWPHKKEAFLKELKEHAERSGEVQMQLTIKKSGLEHGRLHEFCERFMEETGITTKWDINADQIYFSWYKEQ